jgi:hypothetical protein
VAEFGLKLEVQGRTYDTYFPLNISIFGENRKKYKTRYRVYNLLLALHFTANCPLIQIQSTLKFA